jgi:hypothetical protein
VTPRERAHSIGVESTIQTSSDQVLVSAASWRINQVTVPANLRNRLL